MPMTYTEADASILNNDWFRRRVRVSVSTYTNYLLNTATDDPEYDSKISAATRLANSSEMVVNTLMFTLCGDVEVQTAGPAIPDAQLQLIVEKTIVKLYPQPPTPPPALMGVGYYPPPPVPPLPRPQ
jgi:hypothetical protein